MRDALGAAHELEVRVVVIVADVLECVPERVPGILAVPADGVHQGGRGSCKAPEEVHGVRYRPARRRVSIHGRLVERVLGGQNAAYVVGLACDVECARAHRRVVLRVKCVGKVHDRVDHPTADDSSSNLVSVGPERSVHR